MTDEAKETHKSDPKELEKVLNDLDAKKETAFKEKQETGQKIADKIKQLQEFRKQRNVLTKQVQQLKKDRDALNTQISSKIEEIKATKQQPVKKVKLPLDEKGRQIRPQFLQKKIKDLEEKIETVPMSPEAEQKTMKEIKAAQRVLDDISQASGLSGEFAVKSKEIDLLKSQANALHAKVTVLAKESQQYHEKMLKLGNEIDECKKKEEELYQTFLSYKAQYVELSEDVKEVRHEERKVRSIKRAKDDQVRKQKAEEDRKTLEERARIAEEKMARGDKLTTEDLLALQSVKD